MSPSMTARQLARLYLGTFTATALASAVACALGSRLLWNFTPSLPIGLYWLSAGAPPAPGRLVAFPVPRGVEDLVRERQYLPPKAVLVKPVVAVAGDRVCTSGGVLTVNGHALGQILTEDTAGRPLPHYEGCGDVGEGQLIVASHYEKSFDSRTFGPIRAQDIRGTVAPLWTY